MTKIYEERYKKRLNTFLHHIQSLDDKVKLRPVFSSEEDDYATILDFTQPTATLVMQVVGKIPDLLDTYNELRYSMGNDSKGDMYRLCWTNALAIHLGFSDWNNMNLWTLNNSRIWGSAYGLVIFRPETKIEYYSALHRADLNYVINHWAIFVNNINSKENENTNEI